MIMTQKEPITQDDFYKFLTDHDVIISRLAEMIGMKKPEPLMSCFKHHNDWHGRPRKLNADHIAALNEAMPRLAEELLNCRLKFDPERAETNAWGSTYDKGLVEPIKRIGNYLNITKMLERVAGWSASKKCAVLSRHEGSMAGCISKADAVAINQELITIAGVLEKYELVADDSSSSSC